MNTDKAKGTAKDIMGSAKAAIGKATGNRRLEADGIADRVKGKIQKGVGAVKDAMKR